MTTFFCKKYPKLNLLLNGSFYEFRDGYLVVRDKDTVKQIRKYMVNGQSEGIVELRSKDLATINKSMTVLIKRMGGIGDVLFTLPLAKHLHGLGHKVSYYCHYGYWELLKHIPYIEKVYVNADLKLAILPDGFGKPLKPVPGMYHKSELPFLPDMMTPEVFCNFKRPLEFGGVIEANPDSEKYHAVDTCYRWAGLNPYGKEKNIELHLTKEEIKLAKKDLVFRGYDLKKKFVAIAPTASAVKNRSWPEERYLKVKEELEKEYNCVYIHRGEGWTLRQMMAIVSLMDLVVAVDTGVLHIAGAFGKDIVALFGPFNPDYRCGYFNNCEVICKTFDHCENFCYSHRDQCIKYDIKHDFVPCMLSITAEEVIDKVKEKLNV